MAKQGSHLHSVFEAIYKGEWDTVVDQVTQLSVFELNTKNVIGETLLHAALRGTMLGDGTNQPLPVHILELMATRDNVNVCDHSGCTALHLAANKG